MSNGGEDQCVNDDVEQINEILSSPRRASVDGVDVQTRSAAELISLLRYRDQRCAEESGVRGMRACHKQQMSPPNGLGIHLGRYPRTRGS